MFTVFRMGRVGQSVQNLLEPGHTAGVFQRAAPRSGGDQPRRRIGLRRWAAGNQFDPVKPAVAEIVLVERHPRSTRQNLIQRAILLSTVPRFLAPLRREPLQRFR